MQGDNLAHFLAVIRTPSGLPSDIQWIVAIWFLMIGGCFGSLMNVIIYRWPAGLSIVAPGSRCPRCMHPIRLYDNVPVLSWIVLGARCRDCKAPIPIRYPTVEAVVAVLFFAFFIVDVMDGGADLNNLAVAAPQTYWGIYGLHMLLVCMLVCAALIEIDGKSVPAKLIWPPLLVAVLGTAFWPEMRQSLHFWRLSGILGSMAGMLAGGLGGWLVSLVSSPRVPELTPIFLAFVIGAVVGWLGVSIICLATGIFIWLANIERRMRPNVGGLPASSYLTIATLLFLLYWQFIDEITHGPGA